MDYIRVELRFEPLIPFRDILIALLGEQGYESFEENPVGLNAFIPAPDFDAAALKEVTAQLHMDINAEVLEIPHRNWNEEWEREYAPVFVNERLVIRAPFHPAFEEYEYRITIRPEMSFGTGHHPTTCLMSEFLLETELRDKAVLDIGTGTGVLAILAAMRGAQTVEATEIDEHVVDNAKFNVELNPGVNIRVDKGDIRKKRAGRYHVILANINMNALLEGMAGMAENALPGAEIFLSGFYREDIPALTSAAARHGLGFEEAKYKSPWSAIRLRKSPDSVGA